MSNPYICPSDHAKIFGRWVEVDWWWHDGMPCDLIQGQGQGHETLKVWNSSIIKTCLLCHFHLSANLLLCADANSASYPQWDRYNIHYHYYFCFTGLVVVSTARCLWQNAFVTIYLISSFTKLIDMAIQVTDIAGTTHRLVNWWRLASVSAVQWCMASNLNLKILEKKNNTLGFEWRPNKPQIALEK